MFPNVFVFFIFSADPILSSFSDLTCEPAEVLSVSVRNPETSWLRLVLPFPDVAKRFVPVVGPSVTSAPPEKDLTKILSSKKSKSFQTRYIKVSKCVHKDKND